MFPNSGSKQCEDDVLSCLGTSLRCFVSVTDGGKRWQLLVSALLSSFLLPLLLLDVEIVVQEFRRIVPDQSEEVGGARWHQEVLHVVVFKSGCWDGTPHISWTVLDGGDTSGGHNVTSTGHHTWAVSGHSGHLLLQTMSPLLLQVSTAPNVKVLLLHCMLIKLFAIVWLFLFRLCCTILWGNSQE